MKDLFNSEKLGLYIDQHTKDPHEYLATIRDDCRSHKWNFMLTTKQQAAFLYAMASTLRALKILEIGSFYGHSTLALAAALPSHGKIISIEHNPKFANKTKRHMELAGFEHNLEMLVGEASALLDNFQTAQMLGTFDLIFIDADKRNYKLYWEKSLTLARDGGVIICDNVLSRGGVLDDSPETSSHVSAIKKFNFDILRDTRTFSFIAPIADGMLVSIKQSTNNT